MNDPKAAILAGPRITPAEPQRADRLVTGATRAPNKFGTATDGWEAYNSWLDRMKQQPAPPSPGSDMERLLKWLDDLDDLMVVFRVQAPAAIATVLLLAGFAATVGAVLVLGPPDLLAAP